MPIHEIFELKNKSVEPRLQRNSICHAKHVLQIYRFFFQCKEQHSHRLKMQATGLGTLDISNMEEVEIPLPLRAPNSGDFAKIS